MIININTRLFTAFIAVLLCSSIGLLAMTVMSQDADVAVGQTLDSHGAKSGDPINVASHWQNKDIPLLRFQPTNGGTVVYAFKSTSVGWIDYQFLSSQLVQGNSAPTTSGVKTHKTSTSILAEGELALKFYPHSHDSWDVAGDITTLVYQLNGQTAANSEMIMAPFAFKLNHKGYFSHFQFTKGVTEDVRKLVKQLLLSAQVVLPRQPKSIWHTREQDASGQFSAEYQLVMVDDNIVKLSKRKLTYRSLSGLEDGAAGFMQQAELQVENSRSQITLAAGGSGLIDIAHQEVLSGYNGTQQWSFIESGYSLHTLNRPVTTFASSFNAQLARLNSEQFLKAKYYQTNDKLNAMGNNLTMVQALALFKRLITSRDNTERQLADKFLVNYLRLYPQASFALVKMLDQGFIHGYDQNNQLRLWLLIAQTGHSQAQQAVLTAATSPEYADLTRIRALAYLHDFEYPQPEMVEKLWQLHQDMIDANTQVQHDMKAMSLYAIGAMGGSGKLNDSLKHQIAAELGAHLANSDDLATQKTTLLAIANHGDSALIDDIKPYFSAQDNSVRIHAFTALRKMQGPQAIETFIKHYEQQSDIKVKIAALAVLAKMPSSSRSMEWAQKQIVNTKDAQGQQLLVKFLGDHLQAYAQNEGILRDMLKQGPTMQVKKEIYRYITP
ncbi:MAG: HEAT repeat domain-containing protein [Algicola sp.]|nr:HEAT repeat domain-containing protein [Algicola sp.]